MDHDNEQRQEIKSQFATLHGQVSRTNFDVKLIKHSLSAHILLDFHTLNSILFIIHTVIQSVYWLFCMREIIFRFFHFIY